MKNIYTRQGACTRQGEKIRFFHLFWSFILIFSFMPNVWAQANKKADKKIKELSDKIDVLSEEIEKQKIGGDPFGSVEKEEGEYGFGPAASKVYRKGTGVSIGGYGEVIYENFEKGTDQVDALRAVLYFGYKFTDKLLLNTEIEYETCQ